MIGQTNHWITVVVNKVKRESPIGREQEEEGEDYRLELFFLDSRNLKTLSAGDQAGVEDLANQIWGMLPLEDREKEARYQDDYREWLHQMRRDSVVSNLFVVRLLLDCITKEKEVVPYLLEWNIAGFLQLFREEVIIKTQVKLEKRQEREKEREGPLQNIPNKEEEEWDENHVFAGLLLDWMEKFFPAPVIANNVQGMIIRFGGVSVLTPSTHESLRQWVEVLRERVGPFFSCTHFGSRPCPSFPILGEIVQWLEEQLALHAPGHEVAKL